MATGTGNLPYPGKVYNPFDILTAEELNEDVANIESLATGTGLGDVSVPNSALAGGAVTPDKLNLSPATDTVSTAQTTTSTTLVDLATVGPSVTITIGANGLALISLYAWASNNTAGSFSMMGFAASGANTFSATQTETLLIRSYNNNGATGASATFLLTGLTPGTTTFTAKYRVGTGTGTFEYRKLVAVPL